MATRARRNHRLPYTRQKDLISTGDRTMVGNLILSGYAQVGGDLTVEGDLEVEGPVFCLGRLLVKGRLHAEGVYVGLGMEVTEDVVVEGTIDACAPGAATERSLELLAVQYAVHPQGHELDDAALGQGLEWLVDPATINGLRERLDGYGHRRAISVGRACRASGTYVVGDVEVGQRFQAEYCSLAGDLKAEEVRILGGHLSASGDVIATRWVYADGSLEVANLVCSHLEARTVHASGEIKVSGGDTDEEHWDDADEDQDCYREVAWEDANRDDGHKLTERARLPSLRCGEEITAERVTAGGSIRVNGPIKCHGGYLKASGSITAAGKIAVHKDYGVLAGLGVSRRLWLQEGFVSAPSKPRNTLTGVFRPLAKRKNRGTDPKPARLK